MRGIFQQDQSSIVAPDGTVRSTPLAQFAGRELIIIPGDVVVLPGDEIRRKLPNGTEEAFEVVDPTFYNHGLTGMGSHFQVKVRRKGAFPPRSGGNFTIHVAGTNSRVNVNSEDNSVNVAADTVFGDVASALRKGVNDPQKLQEILSALEEMKRERGGSEFLKAYQKFVGVCADHIGVISPFLPALTSMLGGG
jgi:hypothetical protein